MQKMPLKVKPIITLLLPKWRACHKSNHRLNEGYPISEWKWVGFRSMLLHYWTYIIHSEARNTFSDQCLSLDIIDISLFRVLSCTIQIRNWIMKYDSVNVFLPPTIMCYVSDYCHSDKPASYPWSHSCLDFCFISYCKHSHLYCDPIGKVGRLNTLCDFCECDFFPLIREKKNLVTEFFLFHWFSPGGQMIGWHVGLAAKCFLNVQSYGEFLSQSTSPKTSQPLKTVIIPWDT